jgi:hypothetical protein
MAGRFRLLGFAIAFNELHPLRVLIVIRKYPEGALAIDNEWHWTGAGRFPVCPGLFPDVFS